MTAPTVEIETWGNEHPRRDEFLRCLNEVAPEQAPFVLGDYSARLPCRLFVALVAGEVVGFLRYGIQPVGAEESGQPIPCSGTTPLEAKIHAFAVHPDFRRSGIGARLQKEAIRTAREDGCHQLASHSSFDRSENCRLKLRLGFAAAVEGGDGVPSVRFIMPLLGPAGRQHP